MKNYQILTPFLLLMFLLSACTAGAAIPTDEVAAVNAAYTAAAMTISAQAAAVTPTPKPPSTSTPLASPTLIPTIAQIQNVSAPIVLNAGSTCDNSAFISDVTISDGTVFAPGESFTKTWSFQNSGSCTWTTSYTIAFVSGSAMSGSTTALTSTVSSGGQTNVSVEMVAPATTGTYTGYWKLQNAAGTAFGQSVYVQIIVSSDAATITPTPTATDDESEYTSTPTSTSGPTTTLEPTSTSKPTAIPTEIPTNTPQPISTSAPTDAPTETPAS